MGKFYAKSGEPDSEKKGAMTVSTLKGILAYGVLIKMLQMLEEPLYLGVLNVHSGNRSRKQVRCLYLIRPH